MSKPPPTPEELSARVAELAAQGKPPLTPEQLNARGKAFWAGPNADADHRIKSQPEDVTFAVDLFKEAVAEGKDPKGFRWSLEMHFRNLAVRDAAARTRIGNLPKKKTEEGNEFDALALDCWTKLSKKTPKPSATAVWSEMLSWIKNDRALAGFTASPDGSRITFSDENRVLRSIARSSFISKIFSLLTP